MTETKRARVDEEQYERYIDDDVKNIDIEAANDVEVEDPRQYYVLEQASAALPTTEEGIRNRLYACGATVLEAGQVGGTHALATFIILLLSSENWWPFFFLWANLAVFSCRTHGDLQRLPTKPRRLKNCQGAAAYVNFVRLPDKRPHRIAAPAGVDGVYNGITLDGKSRFKSHLRDMVKFVLRLLYSALNIAKDWDIAVAFELPDDEAFLREFFAAFPDWDRSLPVKTIKQQVLLAVEAVMAPYWLTYRGNARYSDIARKHIGPPPAVIGLNSTACMYGGSRGAKAQKRDDEEERKAYIEAMLAGGVLARMEVRCDNLKTSADGTGVKIILPKVLLDDANAEIGLSPTAQHYLDASTLSAGSYNVDFRLVKRLDPSLPFACMGTVSDAQVLALWNVMVRLIDDDGKTRFTRLMLVREKLTTAKVSNFLGLVGKYAGKQPIEEMPRPSWLSKEDAIKLAAAEKPAGWSHERFAQAMAASWGQLAQSCKREKELWKIFLRDFGKGKGDKESVVKASGQRVTPLNGKDPADYDGVVGVNPRADSDVAKFKYALKLRTDLTPILGGWQDLKVPMSRTSRNLYNDCRTLLSLDKARVYDWSSRKIPFDAQVDLLYDGEFPIVVRQEGRAMFGLSGKVGIPKDVVTAIGQGVKAFARGDVGEEKLFIIDPATKKEYEWTGVGAERALEIFLKEWAAKEKKEKGSDADEDGEGEGEDEE